MPESSAGQMLSQYFGFQGGGKQGLELARMSGIDQARSASQRAAIAEMSRFNPTEEETVRLSGQASALESTDAVLKEYIKQKTRYTKALNAATSTLTNGQRSLMQESLKSAKLQDAALKGAIPLALQMATTDASYQGRISGRSASRQRLFGR